MCNEVDRAVNLLTPLNAVGSLTRDYKLVGDLVEKLPHHLSVAWDNHVTQPDIVADEDSEWEKLVTWLNRQRDVAHNAYLRSLERNKTKTPIPSEPKRSGSGCFKCGGSGHLARECRQPPTKEIHGTVGGSGQNSQRAAIPQSKQESLQVLPTVKATVEKCPLCNQEHSYRRKFQWGEMDWPSSLLSGCPNYKKLTAVQRGQKVEEIKGCGRCTSWRHSASQWRCPKGAVTSCTEKDQGVVCNRDHDTSLHGSGSHYCSAAGLVSQVCQSLLTA